MQLSISSTMEVERTIVNTTNDPLSPSITFPTYIDFGHSLTFPLRVYLFSLLGIVRLNLFLSLVHWVLEDSG